MTSAIVLPDLLGTSPADLIDRFAPPAEQSTPAEARRRAERVRAGLDSYTRMRQDIADAYAHQDWKALEYGSWFEYVEQEFGEELQKLSRAERQEAVRDLREQGMSTRQIANATGISDMQVRRDLNQVRPNVAPAEVTGSDGKTYAATRPSTQDKPTKPPVEPKRERRPEPTAEPKPAPVAEAEERARQRSERLAESLVSLWGQLGDDPVGWLAETWRPDAYRQRDMPKVRDVFTPAGLRSIAAALSALADHLDEKGATL